LSISSISHPYPRYVHPSISHLYPVCPLLISATCTLGPTILTTIHLYPRYVHLQYHPPVPDVRSSLVSATCTRGTSIPSTGHLYLIGPSIPICTIHLYPRYAHLVYTSHLYPICVLFLAIPHDSIFFSSFFCEHYLIHIFYVLRPKN
jgi:hypothetical protein